MGRCRSIVRIALLAAGLAGLLPPAAGAAELKVGGTGWALGMAGSLARAYHRRVPQDRLTVLPSLGSSGGIRALRGGVIDIALSARPLRPQERRADLVATQVGRTALVLVSSYSEADRDLTVASVVAILRFERLTWKDGTPIRIIMRPQTETDIGVLEHQSPALKEALGIARRQPAIPVGVTDQDNLALIAQTHGSVGFTALVSARVDAPELRVLPLGGVVPTSASVASGVYPWSKPLYVIVARRPDGRSEAFVDFVQSPAGRRLLERAGCLPAPKDASAQPGARS